MAKPTGHTRLRGNTKTLCKILQGLIAFFCIVFFRGSEPTLAVDLRKYHDANDFGFSDVCEVAESKLAKPFSRRVEDLPCELVGLDYDSWRYIAFHPNETLWRADNFPFQVETVHRGYLFTQRVDLNEVEDGAAESLPFNPHNFDYRNWLRKYRFPRTLGHSGWKLLTKFNDERRRAVRRDEEVFTRELASFLGAAYFRTLGSQHVYGSSLRGLAVDCAMPYSEEFPVFTQFWLERPKPDSQSFRCWALMESERVLGAYQFDFTPDIETTVDVRCKLYVRGQIAKLGIAPITSMWMWGGGTAPPTDDPRSEVHDADGLLVLGTDNSSLWRPLSRPQVPIVNHYSVPGLKAFGLVQRNRNSKSYGDSEALYHKRPSFIIEPKQAWPAGGVELLRLPASHEGIDNVGAFYLMDDPPQDGESIELEYRIHVCDDDKTVSWKHSDPGSGLGAKRARFIESNVSHPSKNIWKIELLASSDNTLLESINDDALTPELISLWNESGLTTLKAVTRTTKGVMVSFEVQTEEDEAFELLLRLRDGERELTEVWCYRCEP